MYLASDKLDQTTGSVPNRLDNALSPSVIGIDFVKVAESHVLLFGKVKEIVHGELAVSNGNLSEFNQRCELEVWLKGVSASRFGQLNELTRLQDAHTEFHQHAAAVLEVIEKGSWVEAERMRRNELSQSLRRVLIALTELNESISKQDGRIS